MSSNDFLAALAFEFGFFFVILALVFGEYLSKSLACSEHTVSGSIYIYNKNGCCDGTPEKCGHGKQLRSNQQEEERRGRRTLRGLSAVFLMVNFTGSTGSTSIIPYFVYS